MATRMNIMKLLLEVRGFAEFTSKRLPARPLGPLLLQFRHPGSRYSRANLKRYLPISIQDPPGIPEPVPIRYLVSSEGQSPKS